MLTQKLIVQPLVENALYHAIEPMKQTGFIQIRAIEAAQEVLIEVIDNGPGFDEQVLLNLWERPVDRSTRTAAWAFAMFMSASASVSAAPTE